MKETFKKYAGELSPKIQPKQSKQEVGRQVFSGLYPKAPDHTGGFFKDLKVKKVKGANK